jgi:hypothetical protein
MIVWALGFAPGPKFKLDNFLYGLTINPSPIRLLPGFAITDSSGEFRLAIPPVPFCVTLYTQALFLSKNPGYSPGSFSNRVSF